MTRIKYRIVYLLFFFLSVFLISIKFSFVSYAMTELYTPKYYDFSFTDSKGKKRDIHQFKTNTVVLIFGRSGCSLSNYMLAEASRIKKNGMKTTVVFFGVDRYDAGIARLKNEYKNVIFVNASTNNNSVMWDMLRTCGMRNKKIMLPATFILNKYGHIKYYSTSKDYWLYDSLKKGKFKEKIKLSNDNCYAYLYSPKMLNNCMEYKKGKKLKPDVNINLGGQYLKKGRDYSVEYKDNWKIGKASVVIRFKDGFKGKIKLSFSIVKKL